MRIWRRREEDGASCRRRQRRSAALYRCTIVSVSSRITYVLGRLYQGRQVTCRTLYEASRSRSEMVATFLALLELIKDKRIWVEGEEADQQVRMRRADEAEDEEPEEENTIGN